MAAHSTQVHVYYIHVVDLVTFILCSNIFMEDSQELGF